MKYTHTQISIPMITITLATCVYFSWIHFTASQELPSTDSGSNFLITSIMVLILCILSSFTSLCVWIDDTHIGLKFGYGIYRKKILLKNIASVHIVKNKWYYGLGIHRLFSPHMTIYNVSGLDAVELRLKNGTLYRIGTDQPTQLHHTIQQNIQL